MVRVEPLTAGAILRDRRDEIVAEWLSYIYARYDGAYDFNRLRMPGADGTPESVGQRYVDMLLEYFDQRDDEHRARAHQRIIEYRRQLGRHCAEVDLARPEDLTGAPYILELVSKIMMDEAGGSDHRILFDELRDVSRMRTDMSAALVVGYMTAKQEFLAQQQRTVVGLLDELARVEARERWSLAMDLHDGLAQRLAALSNGIQRCDRLQALDSEECREELSRLKAVARETIGEVRALIRDLHFGQSVQETGFSALADYVSEAEAETGVRHEFHQVGEVQLPPAHEALVVRIIQEALTNVAKHASATSVCITVRAGDSLVITVQDDGCGFDPDHALASTRRRARFGLSGMRERAAFLRAELNIISQPGAGTTVRLELRSHEYE